MPEHAVQLTRVSKHFGPVNTVFQNYALFPHMTVNVRMLIIRQSERWLALAVLCSEMT